MLGAGNKQHSSFLGMKEDKTFFLILACFGEKEAGEANFF
jgi:hypothetical protein